MEIIQYIGHGKENAVKRETLVQLTGLTDRKVRQEIENARHGGTIIINNQDGRGYFIPTDIEDIEKQYRANKRRALSVLNYQKYLRRELKAAGRL